MLCIQVIIFSLTLLELKGDYLLQDHPLSHQSLPNVDEANQLTVGNSPDYGNLQAEYIQPRNRSGFLANIDCQPLKKPKHGHYECDGDSCSLSCDAFYKKAGEGIYRCEQGHWIGKVSACVETCQPPKKPENGNVNCNADGTTCEFKCDPGFKLDGKSVIYCQETEWTNEEPTCKADSACPKLETPEHGDWKCDEYFCELLCETNYQKNGDGKLVCSNGAWRGKNATCIADSACPKLENPEHGDWKCDEYFCELFCDTNYQKNGDGKLVCSNGAWRGKNSTCIEKNIDTAGSDCSAIQKDNRAAKSGRYKIFLKNMTKAVEVFCDMETDGGGWTVFQRRTSKGHQFNFFRNWQHYKDGFGDLDDEFWLGNDAIHEISESQSQLLRIDMESYDSVKKYAKYTLFNVAAESDGYRLHVGQYSGDAGDSLTLLQNNKQFSTKGRAAEGSAKCVEDFKAGWWYGPYGACHFSNLNGLNLKGPHYSYADGINWNTFKGLYVSLKETTMKMRPIIQ